MRLLAHVAGSALLTSISLAQSFNIDVGGPFPQSTPLPPATYGAAAAQPGTWTAVDPGFFVTSGLLDVTGTPTNVSMTRLTGPLALPGSVGMAFSPEQAALLGDLESFAAGTEPVWMLSGLAPGTYMVYTYAISAAFISTGVSVNGGPTTVLGGSWGGILVPGLTHAVDTVSLSTGGSITIQFTALSVLFGMGGVFNGLQIRRDSPTTVFCEGSSVGAACLACGNHGAAGHGCANSSFATGAQLSSSGVAGTSSATDTLRLTASNITGPGLFFQANGLASAVAFGDGELCAGFGVTRLGVVFPTAGVASYPGGLTPAPIHTAGAPLVSGDVRHYQVWYRDAASFCTPSTFNLTQGLTVTWEP
jgi:hypothetical protein